MTVNECNIGGIAVVPRGGVKTVEVSGRIGEQIVDIGSAAVSAILAYIIFSPKSAELLFILAMAKEYCHSLLRSLNTQRCCVKWAAQLT